MSLCFVLRRVCQVEWDPQDPPERMERGCVKITVKNIIIIKMFFFLANSIKWLFNFVHRLSGITLMYLSKAYYYSLTQSAVGM